VARVLLVGGGCAGLALIRELGAEGHVVRAVTRRPERRAELEEVGAECWVGDPDRIGTLRYALDNVTVLCWFLGAASGDPEAVRAVHGSRLQMMLLRTVDTTVRGVVYEAAGPVGAQALRAGAGEVRRAYDTHGIPYRLVETDRTDRTAWVAAAALAVHGLLGPRRAAILVNPYKPDRFSP
jgi:threonine dehydrogenase-like Zn-dependent dehydrogenase